MVLLPVQLHTQAAVRQDAEMSCTHGNEQEMNQNSTGCWAKSGCLTCGHCLSLCLLPPSELQTSCPTLHIQKRTEKLCICSLFSFIVGNACNFSCLLLCTSEECLRLKPEHTSRQAWSHQCPQGIGTWLWLGHRRVQTPTSTPLCALLGHQHSGLAYRALGNSTHFPVTAINASTKTS